MVLCFPWMNVGQPETCVAKHVGSRRGSGEPIGAVIAKTGRPLSSLCSLTLHLHTYPSLAPLDPWLWVQSLLRLGLASLRLHCAHFEFDPGPYTWVCFLSFWKIVAFLFCGWAPSCLLCFCISLPSIERTPFEREIRLPRFQSPVHV